MSQKTKIAAMVAAMDAPAVTYVPPSEGGAYIWYDGNVTLTLIDITDEGAGSAVSSAIELAPLPVTEA